MPATGLSQGPEDISQIYCTDGRTTPGHYNVHYPGIEPGAELNRTIDKQAALTTRLH